MRAFQQNLTYLKALFLATVISVPATAFAQQAPSGNSQSSFVEFREKCLKSGQRDEAFAMTGDSDLEEFNVKCSHQVALDNGNNLVAIYESYTKKKYEKAQEAQKKNVPIADAARDGTCSKEDAGKGDSRGWSDCLERLKTLVADAKVQSRDAYLKNNKQKIDLVDEKDRTRALGQENTGIQEPKNAMLRDLYQASRRQQPASPVGARVIRTPIYKGLRPVDFGTDKNVNADTADGKVGSSLLNAKKNGFAQGETKDVSTVNSNAVEKVVGKGGTTIDVEGAAQDTTLTSKAKQKSASIDAKVKKLRESMITDTKKRQSQSAQERAADESYVDRGISQQAFEETMDDYDRGVKAEQAKYGASGGISSSAPEGEDALTARVDKKVVAPKVVPGSGATGPAPASASDTKDRDVSDTLDKDF